MEYAFTREDGIRILLTPEHVDIAIRAVSGHTETLDRVRVNAVHANGASVSTYAMDASQNELNDTVERAVTWLREKAATMQRTHEQLSAYVAQKGQ